MSKKIKLAAIILLSLTWLYSQGQTAKSLEKVLRETNIEKLTDFSQKKSAEFAKRKAEAIKMANEKGWPITEEKDGRFISLMGITKDGKPLYYSTYNVDAANSTRTNTLHNGGDLGLNLEGQSMTVYVWDGGHGIETHQEYDGAGGSNRLSIQDPGDADAGAHYHAAHVTGTLIASGFDPDAKGMAPQAAAMGYAWNDDVAEATTAAANGMLVSNHSYGYNTEYIDDWYFGAYNDESRDWDVVMYNAPYYLMVNAAGNDGDEDAYNGTPLDGNSAYDKLAGHSTSKNALVVANAQDATIQGGELVSVEINSSSSEGPTDDYRIKPDITGNGTNVYSSFESADDDYGTISGTSMASPNVTGSLLILQQHYDNINSSYMKAATLKGLVLHTADDAGPAGPDAVFGWGLLNAKKAANTITNDGQEAIISELTLSQGGSYTVDVVANGIDDLIASVSWTDPAGTANTGTANDKTPVLVNDLDIRITEGANTYYPYRLVDITSNEQADNDVDPYERVDVSNPTCGTTYTVTVTHKGTLSASQDYSLIITGIKEATIDAAIVDVSPQLSFCEFSNNTPIDIEVANQGSTTLSDVLVEYEFRKSDNSIVGNGNYTISSLASCNTDVQTVYGDMSINGETYTVNVDITVTGDENSANDFYTTSYKVVNVDLTTPGDVYTQGFEAGSLEEIGWSQEDANGDGGQAIWYIYTDAGFANSGEGFAIQFSGAGSLTADDWLFSPCLYLKSGQTYEVSYYAREIQDKDETIALYLGSDPSSGSMTTTIESSYDPSTSWELRSPSSFTVPSDGIYYLGWHSLNGTDSYAPCIDDVTMTNTSTVVLPQVTTSSVSSITATSADGGGEVTDAGSSSVTERGIAYGPGINPTIASDHVADASGGTGTFSGLTMSSLTSGTTYYVRAYATNSSGTSYGDNVSFSTLESMVYSSCTTTQNNTSDVNQGTTDQEIIAVEVVVEGALNPLSVTSFDFSTNGTTNTADISNAKVYYTGTTGTFSATGQFGSTVSSPNGTFTVNGTQELSDGTNYFWLAYDIAADATGANAVDAECSSVTVGTAKTPTVQAPDGSRSIYIDPCAVPISSYPYTQSFDSWTVSAPAYSCTSDGSVALEDCWENVSGDGIDWDIFTGATGSSGTGPTTDHSGSGNYLYTESSSCFTSTGSVLLPGFNLTSLTSADLIFYYHMYGSTMGTLYVEVSVNGGSNWTTIWTLTGDQGDSWQYASVSLNSYLSESNLLIRFTGITGSDYYSDMALDDISVEEGCTPPSTQATLFSVDGANDNDLTVSWTDGNGDSVLVVAAAGQAVDTDPLNGSAYTANATFESGDEIGTGNFVVYKGTGSSVQVLGLNTGTEYHFAIYAYSSDQCYATPALTGSATTTGDNPAIVSTFPYIERFENAGSMPDYWSQEYVSGGNVDWTFTAGNGSSNPASAYEGDYNALLKDGDSDPDETNLVTPQLDFTGYATATLTFYHTQEIWSSDQDELTVYYKTSAGGAWQQLETYTSSVASWTQETITLDSLSGDYYIAFKGNAMWGYGVCIDNVEITAELAGVWTGSASTAWNEAGNWSDNAVPTSATDVTIPSAPANQPVISSTGNECNLLTIDNGASLTINAGGDLTAAGDFTNNGLFTINSDITGTGSIITQGSVSGTGSYNINQYLAAQRGWYVSSPVSGATSDVFALDANNVMYWWNETNTGTHGWNQITSTTALEAMKGYAYKKFTTGDVTVRFSGTPNNGTIGGLDNLTAVGSTFTGFNLVGNPYPSGLNLGDFDSPVGITTTNLVSTVWYRTNGAFATYNWSSQTGQNGAQAIVPPMQAFWVQVDNAYTEGGLQLTDAARSHPATVIYKSTEEKIFRLSLEGPASADEVVIGFYDEAQNGVDAFDSDKRMNDDDNYANVYAIVDDHLLAIAGYQNDNRDVSVEIGMNTQANTTYIFDATRSLENFNCTDRVILEDRVTGTMIDLMKTPRYEFKAIYAEIDNRFVVHFYKSSTGIDMTDTELNIFARNKSVYIENTGVQGVYLITNVLGQSIKNGTLPATEGLIKIDLQEQASGYVIVKVVHSNGVTSEKVFIE